MGFTDGIPAGIAVGIAAGIAAAGGMGTPASCWMVITSGSSLGGLVTLLARRFIVGVVPGEYALGAKGRSGWDE